MTVQLRLGTQTHAYPLWRWVWVKPSKTEGKKIAAHATDARIFRLVEGKISPWRVQIGARVREKPLNLRSNVTKLSFKNGRHW